MKRTHLHGVVSYKLLILNRIVSVSGPCAVSTRPQGVLMIGIKLQISTARAKEICRNLTFADDKRRLSGNNRQPLGSNRVYRHYDQ
jgi:hypothetical protein